LTIGNKSARRAAARHGKMRGLPTSLDSMTPRYRNALAIASLFVVAACAAPEANKGSQGTYQEQEAVTGSRIARKSAPQGAQSVDGDAVRMQGSLGPTTGSRSIPKGGN
jgi:hypothetical protein